MFPLPAHVVMPQHTKSPLHTAQIRNPITTIALGVEDLLDEFKALLAALSGKATDRPAPDRAERPTRGALVALTSAPADASGSLPAADESALPGTVTPPPRPHNHTMSSTVGMGSVAASDGRTVTPTAVRGPLKAAAPDPAQRSSVAAPAGTRRSPEERKPAVLRGRSTDHEAQSAPSPAARRRFSGSGGTSTDSRPISLLAQAPATDAALLQRRSSPERTASGPSKRAGVRTAITTLTFMSISVKQVQRLLDSFLDVEKLQAGMFAIDLVPMTVCKLLQTALQQLLPNATHHRIKMRIECDDGVPVLVLGDFHRLLQVGAPRGRDDGGRHAPHSYKPSAAIFTPPPPPRAPSYMRAGAVEPGRQRVQARRHGGGAAHQRGPKSRGVHLAAGAGGPQHLHGACRWGRTAGRGQ